MSKKLTELTELTEMQRKFVLEYQKDQNPKQSAIRAGYSPKTASQSASRLLRKVNIINQVNLIKEIVVEKAVEEAGLTVQRIIDGLLKISDFDIRKILDEDGNVIALKDFPDDIALALAGIEIETTTDKEGNKTTKVKIKQPDRKGAWELLGRHKEMFVDKKIIEDKRTPDEEKTLEKLKKKSKILNFPGAAEKKE